MFVLITAGATRNPIDPVRYLSAGSTGRTGLDLARRLSDRGAEVLVLGSEETALRAPELDVEVYGSTRDLMARMERHVRARPSLALLHAAAVGDYEAARSDVKIPSGQEEWVLRLTPTPKIADRVRGWGHTGFFVTFKAASPETTDPRLVEIATAQRARTRCDAVFANVLGRLDTGVWWVNEAATRFEKREQAVEALVEATLRHG